MGLPNIGLRANSAVEHHNGVSPRIRSFHLMKKTKDPLDKFYTKSKVVDLVLQHIDLNAYDKIIEPSAGDGQFYKRLPEEKRLGYDISPDCDGLIEADFIQVDLTNVITEQDVVLSIGNPPFGKNSKLAVSFFNKCAKVSDTIAFILPRTFRKPSVINRLDDNFSLIKEFALPEDSFYVPEGEERKVPTVFQVWEKREQPRKPIATLTDHKDFSFCKPEHADFCIRRVGVAAGKVYTDYNEMKRSPTSHYYIKAEEDNVINKFRSIDWNDKTGPKYDTAGNPSISKHDLITAYNQRRRR